MKDNKSSILEERKRYRKSLIRKAKKIEREINACIAATIEDRLESDFDIASIRNRNSKLATSCNILCKCGKDLKCVIADIEEVDKEIVTLENQIDIQVRIDSTYDKPFYLQDYKDLIEKNGFLRAL